MCGDSFMCGDTHPGCPDGRSPPVWPAISAVESRELYATRAGFGFFELPAFTASSRMRVTRAVSCTKLLLTLAPSPAITEPAARAKRNASA